MFDFVTFTAAKLETFLLIAFRAGGLFIAAPIIGHDSIPRLVKAAFAVVLAVVLVPVVGEVNLPEINSVWLLGLMAAKELLVGFIIGWFFSFVFIAIKMAGHIVGYQIGLMMATVLDPESNSQISIIGEFWHLVAILIFLAINGHHAIISAFADSYRAVPIGVFNFAGSAGEMLIRYSGYTFVIAIKIAAPVIITLFLTSVTLGVVARTVPQMNIFIVGIPIKIAIGLLVLAAALPVFRFMVEKTVFFLDTEIARVLFAIGTV